MNGKYFSSVDTTSMLINIRSEDISSEAIILNFCGTLPKIPPDFKVKQNPNMLEIKRYFYLVSLFI